jgi:hypothetical protein
MPEKSSERMKRTETSKPTPAPTPGGFEERGVVASAGNSFLISDRLMNIIRHKPEDGSCKYNSCGVAASGFAPKIEYFMPLAQIQAHIQ